MSVKAMNWAFDQDVPDAAAKLVLMALAHAHNHERDRCFPTVAQIMRGASMSERTVQRKLALLAAQGFIRVEKTVCGDTQRQKANEYVLMINRTAVPSDIGEGVSLTGEGVRLTGAGCHHDGKEGVTGDGGEGVSCDTPTKEGEEIREEKTLVAFATHAPASPDRFEEFWLIYPKRDGNAKKQGARLAYQRLIRKGIDPERIHERARRLAAMHPTATQYVPMAASWLNNEDFTDDDTPSMPVVDRAQWQKRLGHFAATDQWYPKTWGPAPGEPGCLAPPDLLVGFLGNRGVGREAMAS